MYNSRMRRAPYDRSFTRARTVPLGGEAVSAKYETMNNASTPSNDLALQELASRFTQRGVLQHVPQHVEWVELDRSYQNIDVPVREYKLESTAGLLEDRMFGSMPSRDPSFAEKIYIEKTESFDY